ncbi:small multidrug resistance protein [Amycolatopsis mediterranei S699]|uniref:Small multidrug resistance protein n=2 Tax=Amycolatopsis mediterranei TaxID=33910 RepID=A0A0H3D0P4_AMYMU|nr:SMR family transporter [Amycolatopsis mediterranei]ADJ44195.1 small multidrug resistance protein [Amycolatopsis mediterranei U32]AEK40931.1 small multidrug resistance protein [Amycolatopsis mediterranei S699]AFO75909.1 small multidrug resistance protein [Amycolatopsis mediterranei S699]AGT83038.1 small multidrug resistance protein [Amycolatopsis mediterranei RB]KDO06888.1 membrane protein [Amycolatopsis mediterranei]
MGWVTLVLAGFVEIAWSQSVKPTENFTKPWPTLLCFVLGVVVTKDPLSVGRVAALALIVGGVVLARVTS